MDVHCFAICAGEHRFILYYEAGREQDANRALGRWAADKSLPFSLLDAANVSRQVREEKKDRENLGADRL